MTICLAWIRRVGTIEELVLASDSRLSSPGRWDCCPKLHALPRGDSAIGFAGDTFYAYPVIEQLNSAIAQHPKLASRGLDLEELKGHMLRILNAMTSLVHDLPAALSDEDPTTTFLLAGWSWKRSAYKAWLLHFDATIKRFTFRPVSNWAGGNNEKFLAFTGDYEEPFKKRLIALLRSRNKLENGGFDMEPFEVLTGMLREGKHDRIGGAPQLMKIYRYSSTRPYAVFWPNRSSGSISLIGRPMLDYESSEYLVLDPDTLESVKHIDVSRVGTAASR